MGFFDRFIPGPGPAWPYTNMQQLNLDWILNEMIRFINQYENIQKLINDTTNEDLQKLETKKNEMITLLNTWFTTHSTEIANQLADALDDINEYTQAIIASIPADYEVVADRSQDTINSVYFDIVYLESGTYNDQDGTTKTLNNARKRNRTPIPVNEIAYINIPSGYEIYTYCLDGTYTKFNVVNWTNTTLNTKNLPGGTKYINIAIRKRNNPSDDISAIALNLGIVKKNYKAVPRWNIAENGIIIDGNTIIINENGFSLLYHNDVFHIAPPDLTSITRFTADSGDVLTLAIDTETLSPGVRNDPETALVILSDIPYNVTNDKYIPVAYYYKTYWEYAADFSNLYNVSKMTKEPDYVSWNNISGGIRFEGFSAVVNKNGFCFTYNGNSYYIAPTDNSTVTTFTPEDVNSTYVLVVDPVGLTPGVRNNPSEFMSIQSFRGTTYSKQYITVAIFYKGSWTFNGKFRALEMNKPCPVNDIFNQQHIIAHKGGNTQTENTMANFEDAIENGYKIVEADVQITSDNVPILHHDSTFIVDNVTYTISSLTYAQVLALIPNIAKLEELLKLCKSKNTCIDLDCSKAYTTANINTIYNIVVKYGCLSRVMFTCFASTAKQILNYGQANICLSQFDTEQELDTIYDISRKASLFVCSVNISDFTSSVCDLIHSYGALVKLWTVDDAGTIETDFALSVDFVISNSVLESDL